MGVISDPWDVVVLFAPLVYIVILGRRDQPSQRLAMLVESITDLVKAVHAILVDPSE